MIRRKIPHKRRDGLPALRLQARGIRVALRTIAARVGAKRVNVAGSQRSIFKRQYAAMLERAKAGSIETVYLGAEPLVILGARQLLALVASLERDHPLHSSTYG